LKVAFKRSAANDRTPVIDPLIDALTGGTGFCHSELLFANGERLTALPKGGIQISRRAEGYAAGDWVILDIGRPEAEDWIRNWYRGEAGCHYDYLGLLKTVIPFWPCSGSRWWCSECVDAALWIAGVHAERCWMASPNSQYRLLVAKCYDLEGLQ